MERVQTTKVRIEAPPPRPETPPLSADLPETEPRTEAETGRRQLSGALILTLTMLGVSGANYLLNLALARFLAPAQFGDANLAVNLVLVTAAVAATLQLLSARAGALAGPAQFDTRRTLSRWAWGVGGFAGAAMALGSLPLAHIFNTSTPLVFVVIGLGLPVYLAQAVMRGSLQGDLRMGRLAVSYAVEAATRVGLALVMLALGFGVIGAAIAISLSFVASAFAARHRVVGAHVCASAEATAAGSKPVGPAVSVAATTLLIGQVVIANGDVILAKAVMTPESAGTYAAAAIIGRGLYFLSWAVVHSTFPVVARAGSPVERRKASLRALRMVGITCVAGVIGLALLGEQLVPLLLGEGYGKAAELLVPYAVATALFAMANLVATLDLAVGRWLSPSALLFGAVLQSLLLVVFGATPMSMVVAQVGAMGVTAVLVATAHLCDNRSEARSCQPAGVDSRARRPIK